MLDYHTSLTIIIRCSTGRMSSLMMSHDAIAISNASNKALRVLLTSNFINSFQICAVTAGHVEHILNLLMPAIVA